LKKPLGAPKSFKIFKDFSSIDSSTLATGADVGVGVGEEPTGDKSSGFLISIDSASRADNIEGVGLL
ncbi:unnamed protein product, partial [marine sediment metagenome]